jgi:two-component system, LytTR family, response regulator
VFPGFKDEKYDPGNIIRIEADGSYFYVYFETGNRIHVAIRMKLIEPKLNPSDFLRTHQSHLVNMNHVVCYWPHKRGYMMQMSHGDPVPVARTKEKKEAFEQMVKRFPDILPLQFPPPPAPI